MKSLSIINKVFKNNAIINIDKFNYEYEGFSFEFKSKIYHSRLAKKTPLKEGYFVTFWKKIEGVNHPYDINDEFDYFVVNVIDSDFLGYFLLSKDILSKHNVISNDSSKGKMGIRFYPNLSSNLNATAKKTQEWQLIYFNEL